MEDKRNKELVNQIYTLLDLHRECVGFLESQPKGTYIRRGTRIIPTSEWVVESEDLVINVLVGLYRTAKK